MSQARQWRSAFAASLGPGALPIVAVAIPALAATAISIVIFLMRSDVPITGDGALVLAERYPLTLGRLLVPLHGQLNALPIALWAFLDGPAPKLALLLAVHVLLATVTAAFLVSRLGPAQGFALSLPLAVLGSAYYDLLFPWQIVFGLPMLLVTVATWLSVQKTDRTPARRAAVAVCIILAVLSSNVGMVGIFALGMWFLFERRWSQLAELTPAAFLAAAWFVLYAVRRAHSPIAHSGHLTGDAPETVPIYIASGIAHGVGGWFGLGPHVATLAGAVLILGFLGFVIVRGIRVPPAFFSFVAATFAMFAALRLIRTNADPNQASTGRYHYLVLFLLAAGLGAAAPKIPASRLLVVVGIAAALLNVGLLVDGLRVTP